MIPKVPNHGRIKPKYRPRPNAEEKRYREHIRSIPCLVCGEQSTPHHIISDGYKKLSKNHWMLVPLCYDHHQGQDGYHHLFRLDNNGLRIGQARLFLEKYKIDLYEEAKRLIDTYRELQ